MFPFTDPILVFTTLIFVILAAPLLAERIRVPDLVLLLAAGVLLGPNGAGILERDSAVTMFGSVGLLYIMFLAGLDIDLHNFRKTGSRSILFGFITFIIPQVLGAVATRYILGFSWVSSVLLASMFASHTLLSYPIAIRLGISKAESVAVTVGATVITDTLALLVLAVIADSARGISLGVGFWLGIGAGMATLILVSWFGIPRLSRWFFDNVTETGGSQFLFVLVTLSAFAYFSHHAKMEPIIGAFLAGVAFNRLIPEQSVLMNRLVFTGNTLFIPFFLISVGMLVDPGALISSARSWVVSVVMIVLVIVSKYLASWIGGAVFGYSRDARRVMFGLSVVQAAATLAAVIVGYDLEIFDESVLNGAIMMIAVTSPLGAWAVDHYGRRMTGEMIMQRPALAESEQRILVPVANPSYATRLLDLAFFIRDMTRKGAIFPVTIIRDDDNFEDSLVRGELLLAQCIAHANAADIPISPSVRIDVNKCDGIIRAAKEMHASLVLAGWVGEQTARTRVFGSIMEKMIDACPQRIIFCRLSHPLNTIKRILVLLPPLAERRRDIYSLLKDMKSLSKQIGAEIQMYFTEQSPELLNRIISMQPSRPVGFNESISMVDARSRMLNEINSGDLILLFGERRSSGLWAPTLDKLSEIVVSRFPDNNLLLAYPSLTKQAEIMSQEFVDNHAPSIAVFSRDIEEGSELEAALRSMLETAFPDNRENVEKSAELLLSAAKSYPVKLSEESVMLHAHWDKTGYPVLIIGMGMGGWKIPGLQPAPKIIFGLLNPTSISPEEHLKILAGLGRVFHDKSFVERIQNAGSAYEIAVLIQGKQR